MSVLRVQEAMMRIREKYFVQNVDVVANKYLEAPAITKPLHNVQYLYLLYHFYTLSTKMQKS